MARWFVVHSNAADHHDDHWNAVPNCAAGHHDDPMNLSAERSFEDDRCSSANHARDHHDHLGEDSRNEDAHHDGHRDHVNLVDLSSSIENPMSVAAHHDQHRNVVHLNEDDRHDHDYRRDHWNAAQNCADGRHDGHRTPREVKNSVDDHFRAGLNQEADPCRAGPGRLLGEAYSNEDARRDRDHRDGHWNAAQNCADGHRGDPRNHCGVRTNEDDQRNRLAYRVRRRWNHVSR